MPELEFYGMFDYSAGDSDTYEYTAAEFAALIEALSGTGIAAGMDGEFACVSNGLQITVGSGTCFIKGRYGYNKSSVNLMLDAEAEAYQRIDRVILELDIASRTIALKVLKGTPSSAAATPQLTQTDALWQISLCQALVTAGSTVTLTDERTMTYAPTSVITQLQGLETALAAKAGKPVGVSATLLAANWSGEGPYVQTIAVAGMTADKEKTHAFFDIAMGATADEVEAAVAGIIRATAQGAGTIVVTAFGEMPSVDIPVNVIVMGAET